MPVDFDGLVLAPCMDAFAQPVALYPALFDPMIGTGPFPGVGVFDRAWRESTFGQDGDGDVVSAVPVLGLRVTAFPVSPKQGDRFAIAGSFWRVKSPPLDDGQGHLRVFLYGPLET